MHEIYARSDSSWKLIAVFIHAGFIYCCLTQVFKLLQVSIVLFPGGMQLRKEVVDDGSFHVMSTLTIPLYPSRELTGVCSPHSSQADSNICDRFSAGSAQTLAIL